MRTAVRALVALGLLPGCGWRTAAPSKPITLIVSGDTAGWITPCGCTSNQSGGLPRRGSFVAAARDEGELLIVDAGGAASGVSEYDRTKFKAIVAGEKTLGVVAHNVGTAEAKLGAEFLREVERESGVPFLAANLQLGGKPVGRPSLIHEVGGQRLLLVGVLSAREKIPGGEISPPQAAVLAAVAEARGRFDRAIVLAYLPEEELIAFAESLPEVDVIVGGPTGQSVSPRKIGPTLVASATNKGKFLARITLPPRGAASSPQGEIVELNEAWKDDETQVRNVTDWRQELARRDLTPTETSFVPRDFTSAEFRIAGTAACRDCHSTEHDVWEKTPHAHAWQSLEKTKTHVDAYCQQCHTTGYGRSGGFESPGSTPALVNVGCESCHGPSAAHVKTPTVLTAFAGRAAESCVRCHDRENSPTFDYATYWPRVQHSGSTLRVGRGGNASSTRGAPDSENRATLEQP